MKAVQLARKALLTLAVVMAMFLAMLVAAALMNGLQSELPSVVIGFARSHWKIVLLVYITLLAFATRKG